MNNSLRNLAENRYKNLLMAKLTRMVCTFLLCAVLWPAAAHQPSNALLDLQLAPTQQSDPATAQMRGQLELSLLDLALLLPGTASEQALDTNQNAAVTWGELKQARPALLALLSQQFSLFSDGRACTLQFEPLQVDEHFGLSYAVIGFTSGCASPEDSLGIRYELLAGIDANHRVLVNVNGAEGFEQNLVLEPAAGLREVARGSSGFVDFVKEGIWHIWIGLDHILFLLALLVVAVYRHGRPAEALWPVMKQYLAIVTAFTVAHSITLSLAILGVVQLPVHWVELLIALSVAVAALWNLASLNAMSRPWLAFAFGLLHGFGFAAVMSELPLPTGQLALTLLAFNLGVELGQLVIVIAFLLLVWPLRKTRFYRHVICQGGSIAVVIWALWASWERMLLI